MLVNISSDLIVVQCLRDKQRGHLNIDRQAWRCNQFVPFFRDYRVFHTETVVALILINPSLAVSVLRVYFPFERHLPTLSIASACIAIIRARLQTSAKSGPDGAQNIERAFALELNHGWQNAEQTQILIFLVLDTLNNPKYLLDGSKPESFGLERDDRKIRRDQRTSWNHVDAGCLFEDPRGHGRRRISIRPVRDEIALSGVKDPTGPPLVFILCVLYYSFVRKLDRNMAISSVQVGQDCPAYLGISEHFARLIRSGTLRAGDRLPTVRELARTTGFNKATISKGFADLQRRELVTSRPGRGTIVTADQASPISMPVAERIDSLYRSLPPDIGGGDGQPQYDFSAFWPEPGLFPLDALRRIFEKLLHGRPELLQYGSAQGYPPLREYLGERAARVGVDEGEVVIVQGSQQGLDLVFRAFLNPGDAVAVESPTYSSVLPHLAFHQVRVVSIPIESDGLDLAALDSAIRHERVKLLYFMPNFQNPTGITMTDRKRDELARLAASTGLLVVEDDFEHDLRFSGCDLRAVAGRRSSANIVYLSSFSKSLLPGLRMGWMVAPAPLAKPIILAKKYTDIYTSVLIQAALLEFCKSGQYDRHLRRLRRVCREKVSAARCAIMAALPRGTVCAMPEGGFLLWITLPDGYSADSLASEAARHRIQITPGSVFSPGGRADNSFRLSLSLAALDQIEPGIKILGKLLQKRPKIRRGSPSDELRNTAYL